MSGDGKCSSKVIFEFFFSGLNEHVYSALRQSQIFEQIWRLGSEGHCNHVYKFIIIFIFCFSHKFGLYCDDCSW